MTSSLLTSLLLTSSLLTSSLFYPRSGHTKCFSSKLAKNIIWALSIFRLLPKSKIF